MIQTKDKKYHPDSYQQQIKSRSLLLYVTVSEPLAKVIYMSVMTLLMQKST